MGLFGEREVELFNFGFGHGGVGAEDFVEILLWLFLLRIIIISTSSSLLVV